MAFGTIAGSKKVTMFAKKSPEWTLVPSSEKEIGEVRERCRRLVQRRAAVSAGISAVPLPGLDVVTDLRLFATLIEDINREFGLTPEQVGRLQPQLKIRAYEAAVSVGGTMVGRYITREIVSKLLQRSAGKAVAKQATRFVPLAGQAASAAIGFFAFRQIGYQHVEACAAVARALMAAPAK
jgi:uncharacterized protein (DUF697 family)